MSQLTVSLPETLYHQLTVLAYHEGVSLAQDLEQNNFPVCHFFVPRNLKVSKDFSSSLLKAPPNVGGTEMTVNQ
jgi:hypothetical protein